MGGLGQDSWDEVVEGESGGAAAALAERQVKSNKKRESDMKSQKLPQHNLLSLLCIRRGRRRSSVPWAVLRRVERSSATTEGTLK